jgi:two-component system OmpR family response regulator
VRILIVEDQNAIAADIARGLDRAGLVATRVADGHSAWQCAADGGFDAVVLDLNLPVLDGLTVLRRWRREGVETPVLVLSARSSWAERVEALDAGADDYLVKPFAMEELLARLRALVRRSAGRSSNILSAGNLVLDLGRRSATLDGATLALTPLEFRLLAELMARKGAAVSLGDLVDRLYGDEVDRRENAIEALVMRLRRKIGASRIVTRRGFGYVFEAEA